jgi:hypothetical protein
VPWNQQAMLAGAFQRLAESHDRLKEQPSRVAAYDAIVEAYAGWFLDDVVRYRIDNEDAYKWSYATDDTKLHYLEDLGHGGYDVLGLWRALSRTAYGLSKAQLMPIANAVHDAIWKGGTKFAPRVDGSGGTGGHLGSTWLFYAELRDDLYTPLATAGLARLKPVMAAQILRAKHLRAGGKSL